MKKIKQVKEHMKDVNMKRLFRRNQIIITTLETRSLTAKARFMKLAQWTFQMRTFWRKIRR